MIIIDTERVTTEQSGCMLHTGGFTSLLGLLFIALKLMGIITWSWWWVLAPLWAPPCFVVALILVCGILAALWVGLLATIRRLHD